MKTLHKYLIINALGITFCLMCSMLSYGQHSTGNGSNSGSKPTGGSSGGNAGAVHASSPAPVAASRPSGPPQHSGAPVQVQGVGNVNRQGTAVHGNYGYGPRQGVNINQGNGARGNYSFPQRQGVSANPGNAFGGGNPGNAQRIGVLRPAGGGGYVTASHVSYGNGGYWGNHGYYHYNRGYYTTYYSPRVGFTCAALPYGYYPFFWGDSQYYYSDGLFYQYENDVYTVVEPPVGAEVAALPDKAQSIVINGQQYYELDGVYYQPYTKDDGTLVYVVAGKDGELNTNSTVQTDDQPQGPRIGDVVNQLPPNCRKINVNGQKLYVSEDGIYYQQQVDGNGVINYKIVGLPTDDGSGQN